MFQDNTTADTLVLFLFAFCSNDTHTIHIYSSWSVYTNGDCFELLIVCGSMSPSFLSVGSNLNHRAQSYVVCFTLELLSHGAITNDWRVV